MTVAPLRSRIPARAGVDASLGAANSGRGRILLGVLVAGAALRLIQYFANRSLWFDEALMAPLILDRGFLEVLDPRNAGPVPPGFVLLVKLGVTLFGSGEFALRLVPLLASLAALFLFVAVARRLLTPLAVPVAVALFAFAPYLIYYASEIKPYATDVAAALAVVLIALRRLDGPPTLRASAGFALFGLAVAAFSYTAVFVLAAMTAILLGRAILDRDREQVRALLGVVAVWIVAFGVPYLLLLRGIGTNEYARAFWGSGFMPLPPTSIAELGWFPNTAMRVFQEPLGLLDDQVSRITLAHALVGIAAFAAGCVWLFRRNRFVLFLLVAPIAVTLLVSGLQLYPFGGDWATAGRVILFLAPFFFLIMAEGVARTFAAGQGPARLAGAVLGVALLAPLALQAAVAFPFARGEIKPILSYVREQWREGDVVYVHYDSKHAFSYYSNRYGFRAEDWVPGVCARSAPEQYLHALGSLEGRRVWVLFSHGLGAERLDERRFMLSFLEQVGSRRDDRVSHGASVFLYDLDGAGTANATVRVPIIRATLEESCRLWDSAPLVSSRSIRTRETT